MKSIPLQNTLLYTFPEISKDWDSDKNSVLTPVTITGKSNQKVWWKCSYDHSWQTTVYHRTVSKSGCPFCKGRMATALENLAIRFPSIAKEWHPTKNGSLSPQYIRPFSHTKVWWICSSRHEWKAEVASRTSMLSGCPYCAGHLPTISNNLEVLCPELLKEWDYTKNSILPSSVLPKSNLQAWWVCSKKHSWCALISSRVGNQRGCPYCAHQIVTSETCLATSYPDLTLEWHPTKNRDHTPYNVLPGSGDLVWWLCNQGHEWQTKVYHRTSNRTNCPYCCFTHTTLEKFVEGKLGIEKYNKYPLVKSDVKYQPDYKLTDNIYLNVDGLYWHSELRKPKDYHFKMRESFSNEGKRILQFREDEIYNKWDIVESVINNALGKTVTKINARSCSLNPVSQYFADKFYTNNHLMGTCKFSNHYGLIYNNELISCISTRLTGLELEIVRFATKLNTSVRGGFSKLLKYCIKLYKPTKVISFCDLRYATGKSYERLGFQRVSTSQGFQWTDFKQRYNRLFCKATDSNTEQENSNNLGLFKIYDAGQAKYILEI